MCAKIKFKMHILLQFLKYQCPIVIIYITAIFPFGNTNIKIRNVSAPIKYIKFGTLHEFACHPCAGVMLITIIRLIPTQIACKLGLAQRSVEARGVGRLINLSGLGIAPCPQPDISLNDRVPRYSRAHALHHLRIGKSLWPMAIGHHWLVYLK